LKLKYDEPLSNLAFNCNLRRFIKVAPLPYLAGVKGAGQGLTLIHFSAQLEPCLTQENTLHTLNTP
jgi:hypothetical protein